MAEPELVKRIRHNLDIRERVAEVIADATDRWEFLIEASVEAPSAYQDPGPKSAYVACKLLEAFPQLAEEPEYEYALGGVAPISGRVFCEDEEQTYSCALVAAAEVRDALDSGGFANAVLVRRRRAGRWEVIE